MALPRTRSLSSIPPTVRPADPAARRIHRISIHSPSFVYWRLTKGRPGAPVPVLTLAAVGTAAETVAAATAAEVATAAAVGAATGQSSEAGSLDPACPPDLKVRPPKTHSDRSACRTSTRDARAAGISEATTAATARTVAAATTGSAPGKCTFSR